MISGNPLLGLLRVGIGLPAGIGSRVGASLLSPSPFKSLPGWFLTISSGFFLLAFSGCTTESISPAYTNHTPEIVLLKVLPRDSVEVGDTLRFEVTASDEENDTLSFRWYAAAGRFMFADAETCRWIAPNRPVPHNIYIDVSDEFHTATDSTLVYVLTSGATNGPPEIVRFTVEPDSVAAGGTVDAIVQATDPEGDALVYVWSCRGGNFFPESGPHVQWFAPETFGDYYLHVGVRDQSHFITDSLKVVVVQDTAVLYSADFRTDQVTTEWGETGLLAGLGDFEGIHSIEWDSVRQAMSIISRSNYGTYGFKLIGRNFSDGTYTINVKVPNAQYPRIAFVPKMIDRSNYIIVGINPFQVSWQVLKCVDGATQYLAEGWDAFDLGQPLQFRYVQSAGRATVLVNGRTLWQGALSSPFDRPTPLGVALYGMGDSGPALYDDLRVTQP